MEKFKEIKLFFQAHIPFYQKKKRTKIFVVDVPRRPDGKSWINDETEDLNERKAHGEELLQPVSMDLKAIWGWNLFYLSIIVGLSVTLSVMVTIIPMHNHIEFPNYWWETLFPSGFANGIFLTVNGLLECYMVFNLPFLKTTKTFIRLFIMTFLGSVIPFLVCRLIWTDVLSNNYPMPFLGLFLFVFFNSWHFLALWFEFPGKLRSNKIMRKRIWAYMLYRLWFVFHGIQLLGLNILMGKLSKYWQWIMSVIFPLHREINSLVLTNLLKRTANDKRVHPFIPKIIVTISLNIVHAFFVAVVISTLATKLTAFCILGVDVLINFHDTYKVVKIKTTVSSENSHEIQEMKIKRAEKSIELIGIEIIEMLVPLTYIITFLMAYYGPNAEIIGNVGNSDFHYKEVSDLLGFMGDLTGMFVIDLIGCFVTGLVLWKYASVDLMSEAQKILKLFWALISIKIGGRLFQVLLLKSGEHKKNHFLNQKQYNMR